MGARGRKRRRVKSVEVDRYDTDGGVRIRRTPDKKNRER